MDEIKKKFELQAELKNLFTKDTASKSEFSVAIASILKAVKQFGINVGNDLVEQNKTFNKKLKELYDYTYKFENDFSKYFGKKSDELTKQLDEGKKELKSLLPKEDFSTLVERVIELENEPEDPEMTADEVMVLVNTESAPLIKRDRVEGLDEELKRIEDLRSKVTVQGTTGRDFVYSQDIGSKFDGVLKTFPISGVYIIIAVMLDSYPYGALVEGLHYTYTPQSITFTSEIFEATQLSLGQKCKIIAIRP